MISVLLLDHIYISKSRYNREIYYRAMLVQWQFKGSSVAHIAADNSGVTDAAHPQKSQHFESWRKFKCVQKLILVTLGSVWWQKDQHYSHFVRESSPAMQTEVREIALYGKRRSSEQGGHGTATALWWSRAVLLAALGWANLTMGWHETK